MTEQFILQYLPVRLKELEYTRYSMRYRDLTLEAGKTVEISAYNELFFIIDEPSGIVIESDYGLYDSTDNPSLENVHVHRGEIRISNPGLENRRVKFIQIIIVN